MNKKFMHVFILLLSFVSLFELNKVISKAKENPYLYPTVMQTSNAKKITDYSDAYKLVMEWKNDNKHNSSYKPLKKLTNGYSIIYLEKKYNYKVGNGTIYRVIYDKINEASIYKNNKRQWNHSVSLKLSSSRDARNLLKNFFNNKKIILKKISSQHGKFIFKVFKNNKYVGKYSVVDVLSHYNKILEDDSSYQLSSTSHPKITK